MRRVRPPKVQVVTDFLIRHKRRGRRARAAATDWGNQITSLEPRAQYRAKRRA